MKVITCLILLSASSFLFSQDKINRFSLDYINASVGYTASQSPTLSKQEIYALAPGSALLEKHGESLSSNNTRYGSYANGLRDVQLNIGLKNNKRPNHKLQFGLMYQEKNTAFHSNGPSNRTTIDTLVSQSSGDYYPIDSVAEQGLFANYSSNVVRLTASYRYNQTLGEKWSIYGGAGLSMGATFNSTNVSYNRYSHLDSEMPYYTDDRTIRILSSDVSEENFTNKTSFSFSAFSVLGVNYNLLTFDEKLKNIEIFLEVQPGYFSQYVPENDRILSSMYSSQTLGLRFGF